jgi:glycosyltransferase involved in cell wall biosynthesis
VRPFAFVIPGDLDLPTGGYAYDRAVLAGFAARGLPLAHLALPGSWPAPDAAGIEAARTALLATPPDAGLLIDGLAFGAMPADLIAALAPRPIVALVHHPLGLETGLDAQTSRRLIATERAALAFARHVIVTSPLTARLLAADFGVPESRITVAEPGTEPVPPSRGTKAREPAAPLALLAVGSLVPRKGYGDLLEALVGLTDLDWRLDIVGSDDRDAATTAALRARVAQPDIAGRVTLTGALSGTDLAARFDAADLFVMSSHFEGYGMVLAEALAHGLPIVTTTGGAAAETAPDAAALKVPPADVPALRVALRDAIADEALRARLRAGAREAAAALPRWDDTVTRIESALEETT